MQGQVTVYLNLLVRSDHFSLSLGILDNSTINVLFLHVNWSNFRWQFPTLVVRNCYCLTPYVNWASCTIPHLVTVLNKINQHTSAPFCCLQNKQQIAVPRVMYKDTDILVKSKYWVTDLFVRVSCHHPKVSCHHPNSKFEFWNYKWTVKCFFLWLLVIAMLWNLTYTQIISFTEVPHAHENGTFLNKKMLDFSS